MDRSILENATQAIVNDNLKAFSALVTDVEVLTTMYRINGTPHTVAKALNEAEVSNYLGYLEALCASGITPESPDVEATGLFRIPTLLVKMRGRHVDQHKLGQAITKYRAMAPQAPLVNEHGHHAVSIAFNSSWTVELFARVFDCLDDIQVLEALTWFGYSADGPTIQKLQLMFAAGVLPDWARDREDYYSDRDHILDELLQDYYFSLPLLYLFISHGASSASFLSLLLQIKKKSRLKHIYPLCHAYLALDSNRAHLNDASVGCTPLHLALIKGDARLCALFLACGADPEVEATRNKTFMKVKIKKGVNAAQLATLLDAVALLTPSAGDNVSFDRVMDLAALREALLAPCPLAQQFDDMIDRLKRRPDLTCGQHPEGSRGDLAEHLTDAALSLILTLWPDPNSEQILALQVGFLMGGQRCYWSLTQNTAGAFVIGDWIEMLTNGYLCGHDDIGVTYCKPTKSGMRLFCKATYSDYKTFTVKLTVSEYFERLFQVAGLQYWMYCFFPNPANHSNSIRFFPETLARLDPPGDREAFLAPFS